MTEAPAIGSTRFQTCIARVLASEGGYSFDPIDPGGATNLGVIQSIYNVYRIARGLPTRSVKSLTMAEAIDIYWRQYWNSVSADRLPPGIDYVVFDTAVNSGVVEAIRLLQRAVGTKPDGHFGLMTASAVQHQPPVTTITNISSLRLSFLHRLKVWSRFGRGWTARVNRVEGQALIDARLAAQTANFNNENGAKA